MTGITLVSEGGTGKGNGERGSLVWWSWGECRGVKSKDGMQGG